MPKLPTQIEFIGEKNGGPKSHTWAPLTLISEASLCYPFGEAAEAVFQPPRNADIVIFSAKESWVMLYGAAELYKMKNAGNWFVESLRPFSNLRLAI